jgi:hypothetical protein
MAIESNILYINFEDLSAARLFEFHAMDLIPKLDLALW